MEYVGNIIYDMFLKQNDMKLVIFGAGRSGRKVYEYLDRNNKAQHVKYFCDRNADLWGGKIEGIEIVDPMQILCDVKYHFLVSGNYANEMTEFLISNGVKKIHLLFL